MSSFANSSSSALSMFSFDLERVSSLIRRHGLRKVVLQFPDDNVSDCVGIYNWLVQDLESKLEGAEADELEVYVAADSTFGSSVDDISAEHVDSDVLVYFGSDLSSSGAMPVMVVPKEITVDLSACAEAVLAAVPPGGSVVLTYEPGCFRSVIELERRLVGLDITTAILPSCVASKSWTAELITLGEDGGAGAFSRLGGLELPSSLAGAGAGAGAWDESATIVYVGDKREQLESILMQASQNKVLFYSNRSASAEELRGEEYQRFRERYGGVTKVEKARIIGIIVGSMGLTGESTQDIVARLQALCEAGGRKTYVFVMGRLNEAKLCNFPEVDLFCFISNEDTGVIRPKTFPVPVITPWELELGLGARSWKSCYMASPTSVLGGEEADLGEAIERVITAKAANDYLQYSSDEGEEDLVAVPVGEAERFEAGEDDNGEISARHGAGQGGTKSLIFTGDKEGRLVEFQSPAADFFVQRPWQGLNADVSATESEVLDIQEGRSGIAAEYKRAN